jgi:hypothetical protein
VAIDARRKLGLHEAASQEENAEFERPSQSLPCAAQQSCVTAGLADSLSA